jgi:hypothetical protein
MPHRPRLCRSVAPRRPLDTCACWAIRWPAGLDETGADLRDDRLAPTPGALTDPRGTIRVDAKAIEHGFSGGPMLDPRNGGVVAIVHGMVDGKRLHAELAPTPASGMVVGTRSAPLAALLRDEGTNPDADPISGDDALDMTRRATVHVVCMP